MENRQIVKQYIMVSNSMGILRMLESILYEKGLVKKLKLLEKLKTTVFLEVYTLPSHK